MLEGSGAVWTCRLKQGGKLVCMQLLHAAGSESTEERFCVWMRWGAPGEADKQEVQYCPSLEFATEAFKAKFYEKTNNQWEHRRDFKAFFGKFVLSEQPPALSGPACVDVTSAEVIQAAHKLLDLSKANKWADVFKVLDSRPELVNVRPAVREFGVLHQAAYHGRADVIATLCTKYHADSEQVTKSGTSAECVAREQGHEKLAAAMR